MICNGCKEEKEKFYKGNRVCVDCFKKRRYAHRRANPKLRMLCSARHRAKTEKVPFNLTVDDFSIPTKCPILDIPLKFNIGVGGHRDNSPTLDKIIPKRGYVPDNVAVISFRANRIKNNATSEEIFKIAAWLRSKE
jgi:hypothetical protein